MSEFALYLKLGFEHISDLKGYDHIVFIVALCAVYTLRQWKHLLWLVTAFTIGHSITLALATLNIVSVDSDLVEFLIPVTILIASLIDLLEGNLGSGKGPLESKGTIGWKTKYGLALSFGLIHGLGFSNFLRSILGAEESIVLPLFAFNVGLEIGQIAILLVVLILAFAIVRLTPLTNRNWAIVLSVITGAIAGSMLISRSSNLWT
jgi:hypothetical protein